MCIIYFGSLVCRIINHVGKDGRGTGGIIEELCICLLVVSFVHYKTVFHQVDQFTAGSEMVNSGV